MIRCFPFVLAGVATLIELVSVYPLDAEGLFDGDGLPHGEWRIVHCDGIETTGRFRQSDQHGFWTVRNSSYLLTFPALFVRLPLRQPVPIPIDVFLRFERPGDAYHATG